MVLELRLSHGLSPLSIDTVRAAFRRIGALGMELSLFSGVYSFFEAIWTTAHTFACLRIAGHVSDNRRKANYWPAGLSFSQTGFAPVR